MVALTGFAADAVDVSKLPPPATAAVEYARDVKPILEASCFRCHSGERPRSRFSLADRASALKGGASGAAIIPGDSANSPLIHFVARLVPDLEMPPEGKGEPLSAEQISVLRRWIDDGANYEGAAPAVPPPLLTVTSGFRWITVDGNEGKFREHQWLPDGASGGFQRFEYEEAVGDAARFRAEGRALVGAEDYELKLSYEQRELGFVRAGYSQYRRWFDDTGGFYEPFNVPAFRSGTDLELDTGRAWFEAGLTRPELPRLTLGYEYQFRHGERPTLQWGAVFDPASGEARSVYPALKDVHEQIHVVRFDVRHEIAGLSLEDNFRGEFSDLRYDRSNVDSFTIGNVVPDSLTRHRETFRYFEGANTLRLERQIKDWLLVSGGYLYSNLDGDGSFSSETFLPGDPGLGPFAGDIANEIVLQREAHVFNANAQLGPWEDLTFAAGVQADWTRQEGFGNASVAGFPSTLDSNLDRFALGEHFTLRYTRLPYTVLYADAQLQQEDVGQFEQEFVDDDFGDARDFLRDTDASADLWDAKVGFTVSPWARLSIDGSFRHRDNSTDYNHYRDRDESPEPGNGYPAFIRAREVVSDELAARIVWRATRWLKSTLKYQLIASDIDSETESVLDTATGARVPGGRLLAGNHDAHVYSLSTTLTPWRRLHFTGTFSASDARTSSGADSAAVTAYEGQIYTVLASATYALDQHTDFTGTYSFSRADYAPDKLSDGLPLGIVYDRHGLMAGLTRRFKPGLTVSVHYGFFSYDEPTAGGATDYTAHGLFTYVTKRLP